jgi:choline dehydrogenase-like flavoprotein
MKPGKAGFDSERSRGIGGKTLLWNAVALRFSQRDFKGPQYDGAGEDWLIDYADMAPYYDKIEREVGACGNYDHLEDLPDACFFHRRGTVVHDRVAARRNGRRTLFFRICCK